jgi:MFS family permease
METHHVSLAAYARILRTNANFRRLWIAQIVSEIGDWVYAAAVYSMLFELTGSAKSLAAAFVTQVLPQCLMAPTAGVLNDRLSRKAVMVFADFGRAAVVAAMIFVDSADPIWLMYVLLFLETLLWALFEPARNSVIPNIVEDRDVLAGNALASTTWSFNFMMGFAIGGLLTAMLGRSTVFLLNAGSFILSGILIRRMRFTEPHMENLPRLKPKDLVDFSPVIEGVRYVSQARRLLATMFVKAGLGPMGASWVLFPIMGEREFPLALSGFSPKDAGLLGMSALMGSRGVGALVGPLIGGRITGPRPEHQRLGIVGGFLLAALGYIALGYAKTLGWAVSAVILGHAGSSIVWVFSTTLLQRQTEDRFRGRVFSAEFAFMTLSLSASASLAGSLLDAKMTVHSVAQVCGILVLIAGIAWAVTLRLWKTGN